MNKITAMAVVLVAALALPGIANAQFLLDTGTPTNFTTPDVVSSSSSLAAEFALTAGENLDQISLYLTPGSQNYEDQYLTINLFSSNITSRTHANAIASFQLEYTASGWNTTAANYTALATGDYWVSIQTSNSGYTLDAPGEAAQPTGTAPALAFAYSTGSSQYTASSTASFGIQVGESEAVPEPSSWALAFVCVGVFAYLRRRVARG